MKVEKGPIYITPKQFGVYMIIKETTPEIDELLKQLKGLSYDDPNFSLRLITKAANWDGEEVRSIGWKVTFKDRTGTLEERVKEIQ